MNAKWILAVIIALLLLGGGIGYVTGVLPAWWRAADSKPQAPPSPLHIEEQKTPAFGESGVESHRDLRFQNEANKPLTVRLLSSDCECASVQVCMAPDEWKEMLCVETSNVADKSVHLPPGASSKLTALIQAE